MIAPSNIRLRDYSAKDDPAALALERRCPQGGKFRILFQRDSFARRTEGFETARLLCAWLDGEMIGIGGGAIKDVLWEDRETRALMLYDFRVAPQYRREGIARALAEALIDWARPQAEIGYAYALGDNRLIQKMAVQWIGAGTAPAFTLLAHPTHRHARPSARLHQASPATTREKHRALRPAAMLECPAGAALNGLQLAGCWALADGDAAGCTAWTTRGMLEEVVVGLPPAMRAASWLLTRAVSRRFTIPHVPAVGETLRSWILVDSWARNDRAALTLFAAVAERARTEGIDYCHLLVSPAAPWLGSVRASLPNLFAPLIPFTIMARTLAGRPLQLAAPLVDPRDI